MERRKLILASASPRRREILSDMGLKFQVIPACREEKPETSDPVKAVVIGSDTVVASCGQILGKPKNAEDAFRMLKELEGTSHMVYTGVAVIDTVTGELFAHFAEGTEVSMYPMTDAWIREYIATGEPMDKAGAYAIQGGCMAYIREIHGEYTTVVGFPAARFYQELLKKRVDLRKPEEEEYYEF